MNTRIKFALPLAIAAIILLLPVPEGLTPGAWQYFAVFMGVIVALMFEPLPGAAVGFIGITIAAGFRLVPQASGAAATTGSSLQWALSGFSNGVVWTIFVAFMFAMGYEKTGLGKRISLLLMKKMGGSALGLGYAASMADLSLAPFIPSSTSRSGGTIYPVVKNIPPMYQSLPESDRRKIGAYLMWTCLAATCVTSSMFLTGIAPNMLSVAIVHQSVPGITPITWMDWFTAVAPACIILFVATPLLTYLIYPPTQKKFPDAPKWAAGELEKLGSITSKEITMALLALGALIMWIAGGKIMNSALVAIAAMCLMVIFRIVSWDDVIGNKTAWNTLAWFATLVAMASGLGRVGFLKWLADVASSHLSGLSMFAVILGLLTVYYFVHYFFASLAAHVTALMPVMMATALLVPDIDMRYISMLLCGSLGLMGIITPYGTGPSPIYYNCGYITTKEFWVLGGIFGVIYFAVYAAVSMIWMPMVI